MYEINRENASVGRGNPPFATIERLKRTRDMRRRIWGVTSMIMKPSVAEMLPGLIGAQEKSAVTVVA